MNTENLSQNLQAKLKNCKEPEEILALAKEEGYKLSDEELEAVSGGSWGGGVCNDVHEEVA